MKGDTRPKCKRWCAKNNWKAILNFVTQSKAMENGICFARRIYLFCRVIRKILDWLLQKHWLAAYPLLPRAERRGKIWSLINAAGGSKIVLKSWPMLCAMR